MGQGYTFTHLYEHACRGWMLRLEVFLKHGLPYFLRYKAYSPKLELKILLVSQLQRVPHMRITGACHQAWLFTQY